MVEIDNPHCNDRKLDAPSLTAIWTPNAGLIVSTNTTSLPTSVTNDPKSMRREDYTKPRLLEDSNFYLAFYPRMDIKMSELFSVLKINRDEIRSSITKQTSRSNNVQYAFTNEIKNDWYTLETMLILAGRLLYQKHKYARHIPNLEEPRFPHQYGYLASHASEQHTITCVLRSIEAFTVLSAWVSLAVSLWLCDFEQQSIHRITAMLTQSHQSSFPHYWLTFFTSSIIFNFSPGLRPGAFLSGLSTGWGQFFNCCAYAGVTVYIIWPHDPPLPEDATDPELVKHFYPPDPVRERAMRRHHDINAIILPVDTMPPDPWNPAYGSSFAFDHPHQPSPAFDSTPFPFQSTGTADPNPFNATLPTESPSPNTSQYIYPIAAGSLQKPGETWDSFKERQEEKCRLVLQNSNPSRLQTMLDKKRNAEASSYRQEEKTPVYQWIEDHNCIGYYMRTLIDRVDARDLMDDLTEYQKVYWSHLHQWDFVPHGPRHPEGMPVPRKNNGQEFDEDDDSMDEHIESMNDDPDLSNEESARTLQKDPITAPNAQQVSRTLSRMTRLQQPTDGSTIFLYPVLDYLSLRHGFRADNSLPNSPRESANQPAANARSLCYNTIDLQSLTPNQAAMVSYFLDQTTKNPPYRHLGIAWDYNNPEWKCRDHPIRVQTIMGTKDGDTDVPWYIFRPGTEHCDESRQDDDWLVACNSVTAVLHVYRSKWLTTSEIARSFLARGIPFRTVVERPIASQVSATHAPFSACRTVGLGPRPRDWTAGKEDYDAYVHARTRVLDSNYGRVLLMKGGLIGRIAADFVSPDRVLSGPTLTEWEVVGKSMHHIYIDDAVPDREVDIVAGVYVTPTAAEETVSAIRMTNSRLGNWEQHHRHIKLDHWLDPVRRTRNAAHSMYHGQVKRSKPSTQRIAEWNGHPSWWPKHDTWMQSGLCGDQWLPKAEMWYQDKVKERENRKYTVMSSRKWREGIRFGKKDSQVMENASEAWALDFLRSPSFPCHYH